MKKGFWIFIIILAAMAIFMLTKGTSNAPSEGVLGDDTPATDTATVPDKNTNLPNTNTPEQNAASSTVSTPTKETTVTYGPKGFEPKAITIKAGQTVTFVNESENGMWVGSSKHPIHADYPEKTSKDCLGSAFDQCAASGTGTSYSFTFNKKGSWNYHNHVAPNNWGTVIVE